MSTVRDSEIPSLTRHDRARHERARPGHPTVAVNLGSGWQEWPRILVEIARARGWRLLDLTYRAGTLPAGVTPSGAILGELPSGKLTRQLLKRGCPVVRLGTLPHPKDNLVPAVMHDMPAAGRLAAEYLAERGFRHLGYVGHKPWSAKRPLYEGFEKGAAECGCECHLLQLEGVSGLTEVQKYRQRRALVANWLKTVPKPLAILAFVDGWAATLCSMFSDVGVVVPEEVAVLGYGNIVSACECVLPTLSSIAFDDEKRVRVAAELLETLMAGETVAECTVQIPPQGVVTRESTDVLATPDREVAAAIRYVWEQYARDLTLDEIARAVALPRRTLTRRFQQAVGRSVIEELHRKRLVEARRRLRETSLSIADIAAQVGFHSADYLHRLFKGEFDMTPRQYRLRGNG